MEHFQLYLECLNYHYEVDLLGKSTIKPIPIPWKNNTIKNTKITQENLFLLIEKENLIDNVNLPSPPDLNPKNTIKRVSNMQEPLDNTPLSKNEIKNIFLPIKETMTLKLLQNCQKRDPIVRQLKCWHKYKTKIIKTDITFLGIT